MEDSIESEEEMRVKLVRMNDLDGNKLTRQTKVEFPSFEGNQVQEWLFKCDRFFELDNTPEEMKVCMTSVHLSGLAMEWNYAFVKNRRLQGPIRWEEYAATMVTRFGPIEMSRPIAQLKRLREEENFFTYVDEFVSLVSQVELSDDDQVAMFVEGLKRDNKKFITVLNPRNLQQAIAYAKTLTTDEDPYKEKRQTNDQMISMARPIAWSNSKQLAGGPSVRTWNNGSKTVTQGRLTNETGVKPTVYRPSHKRVSSAKMDERRAKGLCFWCDEKFTFGHKCAGRKLYSIVLEPTREEEETIEQVLQDPEEEEMATLSLHALSGVAKRILMHDAKGERTESYGGERS